MGERAFYRPVRLALPRAAHRDVVVATRGPVAPDAIARALGDAAEPGGCELLVREPPLFWVLVRLREPAPLAWTRRALALAGVRVRYVASATSPSPEGAPLAARAKPRRANRANRASRARAWPARAVVDRASRMPARGWRGGRDLHELLDVRRAVCGDGLGERLAVVDDDFGREPGVCLEAPVLVRCDHVPAGQAHGALLMAWATGARHTGFEGVAPGASPRLYAIPKPGDDALSAPLAIVRAAADGADVILCATQLDGCAGPLFDDALEFARRAGRRGKGALVVMPTSRETLSPEGSLHASFTLGFDRVASDPRVLCVGPSGGGASWFFWRDRKGRHRPFANRGPAVRWLAPGDDLAYPLAPAPSTAVAHAESSGAAALAAGQVLLVLARNPQLEARELDALLTLTGRAPVGDADLAHAPLVDARDALPHGRDRDGHNAKHGYGHLDVATACAAAADPFALALALVGELELARAWPLEGLRFGSRRLGRWLVRLALGDASFAHALKAIARHAVWTADEPAARRDHGEQAFARQLATLARLARTSHLRGNRLVRRELTRLERTAHHAASNLTVARKLVEYVAEAVHEARSRRGDVVTMGPGELSHPATHGSSTC